MGGFIVSPILKTLTETISTDTVYAMVTLMMAAHVMFFDYGIENAIVSPPISLNAALFGAVCLASRLSTLNAFSLLIFAADIFVLLTVVRKRVEARISSEVRCVFGALLVLLSVAGVATLSTLATLSYLFLLLLLLLILPVAFFKLQDMKEYEFPAPTHLYSYPRSF